MQNTSVLQMVMLEEYSRLRRIISALEAEIESLPKGYISKKNIRGNISYYLQWRESSKIKSKYIPMAELENFDHDIKRRKELEAKLRADRKDVKRIEKALTTDFIEAHISEVM